MGIDVRFPIGAMFTLLGVLLAAYGVLEPGQRSGGANGIDINLWWGLCLVAFGVVCLALGVRARRRLPKPTHPQNSVDSEANREFDTAYQSPTANGSARSNTL